MTTQTESETGYRPEWWSRYAGNRGLSDIAEGVSSIVRGSSDGTIGDACMMMMCLEWAVDHWTPSRPNAPHEKAVDDAILALCRAALAMGNDWVTKRWEEGCKTT